MHANLEQTKIDMNMFNVFKTTMPECPFVDKIYEIHVELNPIVFLC